MLLGGPPRPGALLLLPPATSRRAALGFVCLGCPRRGAGGLGSPGGSVLWPANLSLQEKKKKKKKNSPAEPGPGSAQSPPEVCKASFLWYSSPLRLCRRPRSLLALRKRGSLTLRECPPRFEWCSAKVARVKGAGHLTKLLRHIRRARRESSAFCGRRKVPARRAGVRLAR